MATNVEILEQVKTGAPNTATYRGALVALIPFVPVVATIITILAFGILIYAPAKFPLFSPQKCPSNDPSCYWGLDPVLVHLLPLLVGTLLALFLWFFVAGFYRRLTAVDRANEKSYYAILNHLSNLNYHIDTFSDAKGKPPATPPVAPPAAPPVPGVATLPLTTQSASEPVSLLKRSKEAQLPATPFSTSEQSPGPMPEVAYYRDALCTTLLQPGTQWILGGGYSQLWDLVNAAEEALFIVVPSQDVVGEAIYDEMRLNDSKIENRDEWTKKLRRAVEDLDHNALYYLKPVAVVPGPTPGGTVPPTPSPTPTPALGETVPPAPTSSLTLTPAPGGTAPPAPPPSPPVVEQETKQQEQARVILREVRKTINGFNTDKWDDLISARNQLLGTMIFVGLVVYIFIGFATFLQINPQHLVVAAILALIGALAGLVGRWRDELQTASALDDYRLSTARLVVTPLLAGVAAVIGVLAVAKTTSLDTIYEFGTLPSNLIIAVVFGLTPNLLIDQLRKKADGYKADLQSTQPTSGG